MYSSSYDETFTWSFKQHTNYRSVTVIQCFTRSLALEITTIRMTQQWIIGVSHKCTIDIVAIRTLILMLIRTVFFCSSLFTCTQSLPHVLWLLVRWSLSTGTFESRCIYYLITYFLYYYQKLKLRFRNTIEYRN